MTEYYYKLQVLSWVSVYGATDRNAIQKAYAELSKQYDDKDLRIIKEPIREHPRKGDE
jgi:hypothetical protein